MSQQTRKEKLKKIREDRKEHELAMWCEEQKRLYKEGEVEDYKIAKLEALPGWKWD